LRREAARRLNRARTLPCFLAMSRGVQYILATKIPVFWQAKLKRVYLVRGSRGGTRISSLDGANMRRFLLYAALMLYLSGTFAIAQERYGAWLLEYPRSSVVTLSFKRSVALHNEVATSELGFICDQGNPSRLVAILVPFDGTFENWRDVVHSSESFPWPRHGGAQISVISSSTAPARASAAA
jgi:hypothetical protein